MKLTTFVAITTITIPTNTATTTYNINNFLIKKKLLIYIWSES